MSAAAGIDESGLLRRIVERSPERESAFAELFEAYRVRVFTVCRHLTRFATFIRQQLESYGV